MATHKNKEIGSRAHAAMLEMIDAWQRENPNRLLPTALVTSRVTSELGVSGVMVRRHLTEAVAGCELVEVLVRRDWLVSLPYGRQMYAVPDGDLYMLVRERPASKGSNGISFLTTPSGYSVFLDAITEEFRVGS
jgi:hypothetical protein